MEELSGTRTLFDAEKDVIFHISDQIKVSNGTVVNGTLPTWPGGSLEITCLRVENVMN